MGEGDLEAADTREADRVAVGASSGVTRLVRLVRLVWGLVAAVDPE